MHEVDIGGEWLPLKNLNKKKGVVIYLSLKKHRYRVTSLRKVITIPKRGAH